MNKLILISIALLALIARCEYENIADEDSFIMEIIKKHDPEQTLYFNKSTYTILLQDVIQTGMNLAGQIYPPEKISILMDSISDFVSSKPDELEDKISYKDVFGDLTSSFVIFLQENIKKYQTAYDMMYGESEILPPLQDDDDENLAQEAIKNIEL